MPIQAVLDQSGFDGLDESLKSFYVQNSENQQFYFDMPADEAEKLAFNLQNRFNSKKTELDKIHSEKKTITAELEAYRKFGTVDEVKSKVESNRPEEMSKLVKDYEAKIESMTTSYKEADEQKTSLISQLEQAHIATVQNHLIQKLRNEYDLNETADYVLKDFIRVEKNESGQYAAKVYENGEPALIAGQAKTPEQLIKGFVEQKKFTGMFNAGTAAGTGASNRQTPGKNSPKTATKEQLQAMSPTEKRDFYLNGGEQI